MSLRLDTFERDLSTRLGGDYRIRWSPVSGHYHIERKVARAVDSPGDTDGAIRLRDGYALVLRFRPVPYLVCDACHFRVPLPEMQIGEVRCDYCELHGDRQMWFDGYFPLSERTIEYLERGKPSRGAVRAKEMEVHNARLAAAAARDRATSIEAIGLDYWKRASQAAQFGYTKVGTPHAYGSD